jgi:hypothetical protein
MIGPFATRLNTLTIRHRGEHREFRLVKGGYDFDGKRISISIETWAEDNESPYSALFSLVNFPIPEASLKPGAQFRFSDSHQAGWDDENTHANAYFDFHAERVELTFTVVTADSEALTLKLSATTGDYGYDEDDADKKPNPMVGFFRLGKKPRSELWIPT